MQQESATTNMVRTFRVDYIRDCYEHNIVPHHHDYYEIYFFLSGEADYNVEGRVAHVVRGDIMLVSPSEVHNPVAKTAQPFERIVIGISPSFLNSVSTKATDLAMCFKAAEDASRNVFSTDENYYKRIYSCLELLIQNNKMKYGADIMESVNFSTFMIMLNRMYLDISETNAKEEENIINSVTKYISDNISSDLKIETIAASFYISKFHLAHLFKNATGATIHQYILQKRLALSKKYILEGVQISEVYSRCGFKDYSNFFRSFKEAFGVTPKTFYKNVKQPK